MGSIHEQAMQYIYQQVLQRLLEHLSQAQRASLQLLIQRLIVAAGGIERIKGMRLMYVFDASQASAHALACLRAAQLSIASRSTGTFQLRIVTAWQAGMSTTALANIDSCYSSLFIHDDQRIELLVLDNHQLLPFDSRRAPSLEQRQAERYEWLLGGHLAAEPASTVNFAGHGYLSLAELGHQALQWRGGVDAIICADSLADRKRYLAWSRRALRQAKLLGPRPIHSCASTLLEGLCALRRGYLSHLQGEEPLPPQAPETEHCRPALRFVTIDDLVSDRDSQGERLNRFLGYHFDPQAFSCARAGLANPLLLAHMQGLQAEFVTDSSYGEGIDDYQRQLRQVMQRRGMSRAMLKDVLGVWQPGTVYQRRTDANEFALRHYGLSEAQLVCQLFAPFVARGGRLEAFLHRCHPGMLVALPYLHKALQARPAPEPVVQWLVDISGLPLALLQMLYRRESQADGVLPGLQQRGADLRYLQAWAPRQEMARILQVGAY